MRTSILLFLLFSTTIANAQTADSTITIMAHWCKGDTMRYQYEQAEFKIQGTDSICTDYAYQEIQIVVRDSTEHGYSLEYQPKVIKDVWGTDTTLQALRAYLIRQLKEHPALISTDRTGAVFHIENWQQLRDLLRQGLQQMLDDTYTPSNPMQQLMPRNRLEALLNMEWATEENLRNSLDELNLLFGLHGLWAPIGTQHLNDTTAHPTASTITASLGAYGKKGFTNDYSLSIQTETLVPAEEAVNLADDLMDLVLADDLIGKVNHLIGGGNKGPLKINNSETYHYFYNGWPCMILQQHTISYQGMRHIKVKRIEWTQRIWTERQQTQAPQATF